MFTVTSVSRSVKRGDFAFKIGLKDTHIHILINPEIQKYLLVTLQKRSVYFYSVAIHHTNCSHGWDTLWPATSIAKLISVLPYINEWFAHHLGLDTFLNHQSVMLELVGFKQNVKKSELEIVQFVIQLLRVLDQWRAD